mmetsp:Transcript_65632/g.140305  ORF Transcript_65632/g.140305 Transcript_65632/m.140305 type:complete len:281 (+) Transcript_65632:2628-3470(+)
MEVDMTLILQERPSSKRAQLYFLALSDLGLHNMILDGDGHPASHEQVEHLDSVALFHEHFPRAVEPPHQGLVDGLHALLGEVRKYFRLVVECAPRPDINIPIMDGGEDVRLCRKVLEDTEEVNPRNLADPSRGAGLQSRTTCLFKTEQVGFTPVLPRLQAARTNSIYGDLDDASEQEEEGRAGLALLEEDVPSADWPASTHAGKPRHERLRARGEKATPHELVLDKERVESGSVCIPPLEISAQHAHHFDFLRNLDELKIGIPMRSHTCFHLRPDGGAGN